MITSTWHVDYSLSSQTSQDVDQYIECAAKLAYVVGRLTEGAYDRNVRIDALRSIGLKTYVEVIELDTEIGAEEAEAAIQNLVEDLLVEYEELYGE